MTAPNQVNIALTRGDDYAADVTFDQAVSSFAEMRFTVREGWALSEADNTEATLSVLLTATGTNEALLELTSAQTQALEHDEYVYDIQVTTVGGKKYTTQRGPLRLEPDVSR